MNNPVAAIDEWLIDQVFEPLAWTVERATKINNFLLGRILLVITTAFTAVQWANTGAYAPALLIGVSCMLFVIGSIFNERRVKQGFVNSNRLKMRYARAIFILLGMITWIPTESLFGWSLSGERVLLMGIVATLYFFACSSPPPQLKKTEAVVTS